MMSRTTKTQDEQEPMTQDDPCDDVTQHEEWHEWLHTTESLTPANADRS